MLIKYRTFYEDTNTISYAISTFSEVEYNTDEGLCYLSVLGKEGDILFSMTESEYLALLYAIREGAKNNFVTVPESYIGLYEDYNCPDSIWDEHLKILQAKFDSFVK